jgi:hypothetical protein
MSKPTGFHPAVIEGIMLRDGLRCSMEGFPSCPGRDVPTSDPGHRLNRGQGGDTRPFMNHPANGAAQHHVCNWRLEQINEFAEEGLRRGCKISHSDDDGRQIATTPMWHPFFGQWVMLRPAGLYLTGDTVLADRDARLAIIHGDEATGFSIEWGLAA